MAAKQEKNFSQIILKDDEGRKYTLEFNRRIVKRMEKNGFKLDMEQPNNMIADLFQGAFLMHHKGMTPDRISEIWDVQRKKDELLAALSKLYMQPLNDLMAEPEGEDDSPTWETA